MSSVALQIAVILLLILLNGLFAMSETALVSSRKARRAAGRRAALRARASALRRTSRLRRRGGRDHLPLAHPRRAGAQTPRAKRRGGGGLARLRSDAPHLGHHRPRGLVPERLDRGRPLAAPGALGAGIPGERAGGRDPHGGGGAGGGLRGRRAGLGEASAPARRPTRARADDPTAQGGVAGRRRP